MNEVKTEILIAAQELSGTIPEGTIEEKLSTAMSKARHHWFVTNPDDQFKAAVGAVMLTATEEEKGWITEDMANLGKASAVLNALIAGAPIDFDSIEKSPEPHYPLMALWYESEGK